MRMKAFYKDSLTRAAALLYLLCLTAAVLLSAKNAYAYSGGVGTKEDPYQIACLADWLCLVEAVDTELQHFLLTANVDCGGSAMRPVGDEQPFQGILNGGDYSLSGAEIVGDNDSPVGLFRIVGAGALIKNLRVTDVTVRGKINVGGLAGINQGTLRNCRVQGAVEGSMYGSHVGGLVGYNDGGVLAGCHSEGTLTGAAYCQKIGGLAGYNSGTITECSAQVDVIGFVSTVDVGGLVGVNDGGAIKFSCASGSVTGGWGMGGLVGTQTLGTIHACYATASARGMFNNVGGLVGLNRDKIIASYSTGLVVGLHHVGGLVGQNLQGLVYVCFWDKERSGRDESAGGRALLTQQMSKTLYFKNKGWETYPWVLVDGEVPRLAWEK